MAGPRQHVEVHSVASVRASRGSGSAPPSWRCRSSARSAAARSSGQVEGGLTMRTRRRHAAFEAKRCPEMSRSPPCCRVSLVHPMERSCLHGPNSGPASTASIQGQVVMLGSCRNAGRRHVIFPCSPAVRTTEASSSSSARRANFSASSSPIMARATSQTSRVSSCRRTLVRSRPLDPETSATRPSSSACRPATARTVRRAWCPCRPGQESQLHGQQQQRRCPGHRSRSARNTPRLGFPLAPGSALISSAPARRALGAFAPRRRRPSAPREAATQHIDLDAVKRRQAIGTSRYPRWFSRQRGRARCPLYRRAASTPAPRSGVPLWSGTSRASETIPQHIVLLLVPGAASRPGPAAPRVSPDRWSRAFVGQCRCSPPMPYMRSAGRTRG